MRSEIVPLLFHLIILENMKGNPQLGHFSMRTDDPFTWSRREEIAL